MALEGHIFQGQVIHEVLVDNGMVGVMTIGIGEARQSGGALDLITQWVFLLFIVFMNICVRSFSKI